MSKQEQVVKPQNIVKGKGVNLIPPLTDQQVKLEKTKVNVNINSAFALLFLILLTILIFGFNLLSKMDLNRKTKELYAIENSLNSRADLLSSNDEILRRMNLYKDIEKKTFSSKQILDYWQEVSKDHGTISAIELNSGMNFTVTGTAPSLTDVSKLWYKLGIDKRIEIVDLKNVSKGEKNVRFNFEGKLNFEEFIKDGSSES